MKKSDKKTASGKPETSSGKKEAKKLKKEPAVQDMEAREPAAADEEAGNFSVPDCCRHKTRERSEKEYKDLVNRLSRIEGQVRGVRKMLDDNAYCIDIITQVSAINAALNSFNKVLLTNHMETCVMDEVKEGKTDKMEELIRILPKLMK